jgi:hypothetical protein
MVVTEVVVEVVLEAVVVVDTKAEEVFYIPTVRYNAIQ